MDARRWLEQTSDAIEIVVHRYLPGVKVIGGNAFVVEGYQGASFDLNLPLMGYSEQVRRDLDRLAGQFDVEVIDKLITLTPNVTKGQFSRDAIEGRYCVVS